MYNLNPLTSELILFNRRVHNVVQICYCRQRVKLWFVLHVPHAHQTMPQSHKCSTRTIFAEYNKRILTRFPFWSLTSWMTHSYSNDCLIFEMNHQWVGSCLSRSTVSQGVYVCHWNSCLVDTTEHQWHGSRPFNFRYSRQPWFLKSLRGCVQVRSLLEIHEWSTWSKPDYNAFVRLIFYFAISSSL
jgi:hypothetical protein